MSGQAADAGEPAGVPLSPLTSDKVSGWKRTFIGTFNNQTQGKRGCAVALMQTGVIRLVFQTDGGKVQVCLSILRRELVTVFLPHRLDEGGGRLQGTVQSVGRLLGTLSDHVLLHPGLIHACLSCEQRQVQGARLRGCGAESRDLSLILINLFCIQSTGSRLQILPAPEEDTRCFC